MQTPALSGFTTDATTAVLDVWQLNQAVAKCLERSFPLIWVRGEVSNLTRAASGHCYFTLKDAQASVRCVMFKAKAQASAVLLRDGLKIEARALVSLYQARGDFQLNIEALRVAGAGSLHEQFLQIKERLLAQGLLDAQRKRAIPAMPRAIGVVSSLQAAALQDVLTCLARRVPHIPVVVYPSAVQGEQAAGQLLHALERAAQRNEVDVLLLVRGGGSIEDLWSFNDEALALQITRMPMPVISGVGHETDFTIADFVADMRAPTPTAAAELAAITQQALFAQSARLGQNLHQTMQSTLDICLQSLDRALQKLPSPVQQLQRQQLHLLRLIDRLRGAQSILGVRRAQPLNRLSQALRAARPQLALSNQTVRALQHRITQHLPNTLHAMRARLRVLQAQLEGNNPQAPLSKGYALVFDAHGGLVRQAKHVQPDQILTLQFADGQLDARILPDDDLPLFRQ